MLQIYLLIQTHKHSTLYISTDEKGAQRDANTVRQWRSHGGGAQGGTCPQPQSGQAMVFAEIRGANFSGGEGGVLPDGPVTSVTQCRTTTIRINHL